MTALAAMREKLSYQGISLGFIALATPTTTCSPTR